MDKRAALSGIEKLHTSEHESYNIPLPPLQVIEEMRVEYAMMLYDKELEAAQRFVAAGEDEFYKASLYTTRSILEIHLASSHCSPQHDNVAIIGSGAMPMTGLNFAAAGYSVALIDRDQEAIALARKVVDHVKHQVTLHNVDAATWEPEPRTRFVIVAGSVGITETEKVEIATTLLRKLEDDACVCFRQPIREEILLMAPLPKVPGVRQVALIVENSKDYTCRTLLGKTCSLTPLWPAET